MLTEGIRASFEIFTGGPFASADPLSAPLVSRHFATFSHLLGPLLFVIRALINMALVVHTNQMFFITVNADS